MCCSVKIWKNSEGWQHCPIEEVKLTPTYKITLSAKLFFGTGNFAQYNLKADSHYKLNLM